MTASCNLSYDLCLMPRFKHPPPSMEITQQVSFGGRFPKEEYINTDMSVASGRRQKCQIRISQWFNLPSLNSQFNIELCARSQEPPPSPAAARRRLLSPSPTAARRRPVSPSCRRSDEWRRHVVIVGLQQVIPASSGALGCCWAQCSDSAATSPNTARHNTPSGDLSFHRHSHFQSFNLNHQPPAATRRTDAKKKCNTSSANSAASSKLRVLFDLKKTLCCCLLLIPPNISAGRRPPAGCWKLGRTERHQGPVE